MIVFKPFNNISLFPLYLSAAFMIEFQFLAGRCSYFFLSLYLKCVVRFYGITSVI